MKCSFQPAEWPSSAEEEDRAKEVYMEERCEDIMGLQKKGRYDLMYQKAQELGGRTSKVI